MSNIKSVAKKYWKVYLFAILLAFISDSIGTKKINIGIGILTIFPMVFATILGGFLGPDAFKLCNTDECKLSGDLVLVVLAPFMAKMGISAGANLVKLIQVSPALILQEFGNLATIFLALPIALLLGLKEEAIGACYSINRDCNLGLTTDVYGTEAAEYRGTFAVYIVGSVLGAVFTGFLVSIVASWGIFHPIALGMASGVGSGSMMTVATGTLGAIYPKYAGEIALYGATSDMMTGVDGIYIGTFIGLPLTRWMYKKLEPKLGHLGKKSKIGGDFNG